jgi:hypothetical protein
MTINPMVGVWLNVLVAVLGALAGLTQELTTLFGQHGATIVVAATLIALAVVNAVLHSIPSKSTPEALAKFPLGTGKPVK